MQLIMSMIILFIISIVHSIVPHFAIQTHQPKNETDRNALFAIKSKISHDPNMLLSSWNESTPLCEWWGVTCGARKRRVVGLDLSSSGLVGTLSPFVGNLSFLHELMLYNNTFQGEIPPQIGHLYRLHLLGLHNNSFQGEIPSSLSHCVRLTRLFLSRNKLTGRIPVELSTLPNLKWYVLNNNNLIGRLQETGITNMTSLEKLALVGNHLEGSIPDDIGKLQGLTTLALGENRISGMIPSSLFNLSLLTYLYLDNCGLHGQLPQDLGLLLPNLQYILLFNNYLSGSIPKTLSNLSELIQIDISNNNFTGKFVFNGKSMQNLMWFSMNSAISVGDEANDLIFLETLSNCSNLGYLEVGGNGFRGTLPNAILNLSTNLMFIDLSGNRISGRIPLGMSKFVNLYGILLRYNQFSGPIPTEFGDLENLELVDFSFNQFSGSIPSSLGNLSLLSDLIINNNNFVGQIPPSLGNCKYLLRLYVFNNNISGVLPPDLFRASQLLELLISQNNLQGSLPVEISNLKNLVTLDVSDNMFSSEIPSTLGSCTSLLELDMGGNSFSGSIPLSLSSLKSIHNLNLSHNNLSGEIPSYFSTLSLVSLDLSFNNFEGKVPVTGIFSNSTAVLLSGNKNLCGGMMELKFPRCPSESKSKRRKISMKMLKIIIVTSAIIMIVIALLLALLFCFLKSRKKIQSGYSEPLDIRAFMEVSYRMLWEATEGFSPSNMIGSGGFGFVYKGILHQGDEDMQVAIKVMNLYNERADKSLIAECKALRNIRHRNLVKIITACSSIDYQGNDFKALVYEFMPKGSLESWLHPITIADEQGNNNPLHYLNLVQRVSIALDVACAVEYLHSDCPTPIIHCDLKPSNILLDDEMVAHVSDFGLAKFLFGGSGTGIQTISTQVRGTVGYTTPEYGLGSKVSAEGDVYSFGIIVLEMMTLKKPTDPTFNGDLNLHNYAKSSFPDQVMYIVDPKLTDDGNMSVARNNDDIKKIECMKSLISIGIQCSQELPQDRMKIKDVVNQLKSAKQNLIGRRI